jgi:hypothetical protein
MLFFLLSSPIISFYKFSLLLQSHILSLTFLTISKVYFYRILFLSKVKVSDQQRELIVAAVTLLFHNFSNLVIYVTLSSIYSFTWHVRQHIAEVKSLVSNTYLLLTI